MTAAMATKEEIPQLLSRAKEGDLPAFEELAALYQTRLMTLIRARLGPHLRASLEPEDVLQEALFRAFRSIGKCQALNGEIFFSWLGTVVENVIRAAAVESKTRGYIQLDRDPADSHIPPSRALRREERFDRLRESLANLSREHREVIVLARIQRLPIKDIAQRMDRSPEAVKKLLARALRKLKSSFGDTESLHLPTRSLNGEEGDGRH